MRYPAMVLVFVATVLYQPHTLAVQAGHGSAKAGNLYQQPIRRNYFNTSRYLVPGRGVVIEGTAEQVMRISGWLDEISTIPYGRETLYAILSSGNQLTIRHSPWALLASGRTLAAMSEDLTNGLGEDVLILFDVRIPEHGSHRVFDSRGDPLEFTAVQNLFHELSHARHKTNGDWRYWDSEGQAIADENIFRAQLQEAHGGGKVLRRAGVEGEQFWWPEGAPPRGGF